MDTQDKPVELDALEEVSNAPEAESVALSEVQTSADGQTTASGLYEARRRSHHGGLTQEPLGTVAGIRPVRRETLRLDVDGRYPQMTASGTIHGSLATRIHWIANLTAGSARTWTGTIWYKDGALVSFPYTTVRIKVQGGGGSQRRAKVTFSGGGLPKRKRTFRFKSRFFRRVSFEFDWAQGEAADVVVQTCAHPNRPVSLPCETLSVPEVFRRTGLRTTVRPGGEVPINPWTGADAVWSDQEMHDAMQTFWSRFDAKAQWAMWVFFASLHERGFGLGGIMFDDIGPNHRQGTAIFIDSFISQAPAGDPNPAAWVDRTLFFTTCHEMGHAFNLAHSWQKSLGPPFGIPWIPLVDEPEARSFMNYPDAVNAGQQAFFSDFAYRFSNQELLFMRHAPEQFVRMGDADWFDHHGFQEANVSAAPPFSLTLRANREAPVFEHMEPVILELKLKNTTSDPKVVDRRLLEEADAMVVVVKRDGEPSRRLLPFVQRCYAPEPTVLMPGESMYAPLLASVGLGGWEIADPGGYMVQLVLRVHDQDIVSNPLDLRVEAPASRAEEILAPRFFSEDVARIIAFNGSRALKDANDVLREVVGALPDRRVALHARYALGNVLATDYKELLVDPDREQALAIEVKKPEHEEAQELISGALTEDPQTAIESFGHIEFRRLAGRFGEWLSEEGADEDAAEAQETLYETLAARTVQGTRIRPDVLEEVKSEQRKPVSKPKSKSKSRSTSRTRSRS